MPAATPEVFKHKGRAHAGKAHDKPTSFEPGQELTAAPAADDVAALDRPRPATTRYPISREAFTALEAAAATRKLKKKKAKLVQDKAGAKSELATAPGIQALASPMALLEPAPVAAAPGIPLGNFGGVTDTGWFPPDCTMAAGPAHVLLSVNSTVSVYTKAGALALGPRTLSAWFANVISGAKIF